LLKERPQDIVLWLIAGAIFEHECSVELKNRNIFADALLAILVKGKRALLHIEFQSSKHAKMRERLMEYNVLASSQNDWVPVYTVVIYLRKTRSVPKTPFIRRLPNGEEVHRFHFRVIELWKIAAIDILQAGLPGLLPLLPLTDGGTQPEAMEEMITTLVDKGETELLALGYAFGGLVPKNPAFTEWLKRRFAMLEDILEESWTYQEIVRKGMQKGIQQGLQQGREEERQRRVQEQHQTLISLIQMRFPQLASLAKRRVAGIKDPEVLHNLISKMFAVQTTEEAKQALMEVQKAK
jgi:predicted transposase/invertase (TIGR01784 family)